MQGPPTDRPSPCAMQVGTRTIFALLSVLSSHAGLKSQWLLEVRGTCSAPDVVAAGPKALLTADGAPAIVHQVAKEFPARWHFVTRDPFLFCHSAHMDVDMHELTRQDPRPTPATLWQRRTYRAPRWLACSEQRL